MSMILLLIHAAPTELVDDSTGFFYKHFAYTGLKFNATKISSRGERKCLLTSDLNPRVRGQGGE